MKSMNLGLESLNSVQEPTASTVQDKHIHQLATDVCLDFYQELEEESSEQAYDSAIAQLKNISSAMESLTSESREAVLDFLSQDTAFATIVGTENRYENLQTFLKNQEASQEGLFSVLATGGKSAGLALYLVKIMIQRSVDGCAKLCDKVKVADMTNLNNTITNVPSYADFKKHMDVLDKFVDGLEKGLSDPKKWTEKEAVSLVKMLGFKSVTEQDLFSWSASFKSAFFGSLKTSGWGIVAALGAGLAVMATGGLAMIPATIASNVFATYKAAKSYHDSYSKGLNDNGQQMISIGYTPENLTALCKQFAALIDKIKKLAAIKSADTIEKQQMDLFHGTVNVFSAALKGTAKVLADLIRVGTNY